MTGTGGSRWSKGLIAFQVAVRGRVTRDLRAWEGQNKESGKAVSLFMFYVYHVNKLRASHRCSFACCYSVQLIGTRECTVGEGEVPG